MDRVMRLIRVSLASFERDPPDNDYQRGYQAALADLKRDLERPED